MKYLILILSMLCSVYSYAETTTFTVSPSTGEILTADPTIDLSTTVVEGRYFYPPENIILVSTASKAWLNIGLQWYVLPLTNFTLVIDDNGEIQIPAGATLAAGPYGAEPILQYKTLEVNCAEGSCTRLIKINGKWKRVSCCKTGYQLVCYIDGAGNRRCKCFPNPN